MSNISTTEPAFLTIILNPIKIYDLRILNTEVCAIDKISKGINIGIQVSPTKSPLTRGIQGVVFFLSFYNPLAPFSTGDFMLATIRKAA